MVSDEPTIFFSQELLEGFENYFAREPFLFFLSLNQEDLGQRIKVLLGRVQQCSGEMMN